MDPDVVEMLGLDHPMPDLLDVEACMIWAEHMSRAFLRFEHTFFHLPDGRPWLRKRFHKRWVMEVMLAYATGGYLQILSPPRHGKTELLTHLLVWLIARNPNIRIIWITVNAEDVATERVSKLKDLLEDPILVDAVLPPGKFFAPPKRGASTKWDSLKLKVDCRASGIAGWTVTAGGRGGGILSKNADFIVCDDIEDSKSTAEPGKRAKTRTWFGQDLDSRKEEHTPFVVIGSRQHHDDLYGYNIDNPNFRNVTEAAHNEACIRDPFDLSVHVSCMLFPELRSYRWLMSKKANAETNGTLDVYEMVYFNTTRAKGLGIYTNELVASAFNGFRVIDPSLMGIPELGRKKVAGLDPSAVGYQSAFAWAVTPIVVHGQEYYSTERNAIYMAQDSVYKAWMIDIDNRLGGGIDAWLEIGELWRVLYGIKHWVIEDKGFQAGYRTDPRVVAWARQNGIHLEGHETEGGTKHDPLYGVGAGKGLFNAGLIDLPYGNAESIAKSELYRRQLVGFTDDPAKQRKKKSDVLMAGWFPRKTIRRWEKELVAAATKGSRTAHNPYPSSYPGIKSFTKGMNQAPWRDANARSQPRSLEGPTPQADQPDPAGGTLPDQVDYERWS